MKLLIIGIINIVLIYILYRILIFMKKSELKNKTNLIEEYLKLKNLIIDSTFLFNMDFNPDYDYTDYGRDICQTYYFHEKIDFSNIFSGIISHSEIIPHIFSQYDKPSFLVKELSETSSNEINQIMEKECPEKFDSFELLKCNLYSIDNIHKTLNYDCTCNTESSFLGNDALDIYFEVDLYGITEKIIYEDLYNQLIVDSYRKYLNEDYRMSFFLMYSAFECFINLMSGKPDEEKRLVQKKNELFKEKFPMLNTNQINSSVDMDKYEKKRNTIVHGRENLIITKEMVDDIYFDFISLIISYLYEINTFDDIKQKIGLKNFV